MRREADVPTAELTPSICWRGPGFSGWARIPAQNPLKHSRLESETLGVFLTQRGDSGKDAGYLRQPCVLQIASGFKSAVPEK